jgi:prepilin-type N-terminal cleavage/methylation domain-containing protein
MNIPLNRLKLLSQHGFTLIEMLISIAIMGVITFSLISVFTTQDLFF